MQLEEFKEISDGFKAQLLDSLVFFLTSETLYRVEKRGRKFVYSEAW